ncbi:MAG: ankyrin repeat domain-containing protein [Deltaproteobacteria bacterium]|nr:ankyrin repeat domain-containing protein [Deltaproteobacteria bacterium]
MKFIKSFSLSLIFLLYNCSNFEVIDIPLESIIDNSNFEDILSAEGLNESGLYWEDKNNNSVLETFEIKGGKNFLFIEDSNNSIINNIAQLDQTYSALSKEDIKLYLQNIIKTDDISKMRNFSYNDKNYLGRWDPDFSPILFSIKNNAINSLDYMLEEDVRDFLLKEEYEQILITAVDNDNMGIVDLILKKTDLINLQTENGTTALIHAVKNGNIEIAKLLLEKDADKEIMDANKKTALMHAYINNNEEA